MRAIVAAGKAFGRVVAPPSKSMAHRMLIGAGLATGVSRIRNIDLSEDIQATLGVLEALGCSYEIDNREVVITGIGSKKIKTDKALDCKESGSTLRFFIPLLLAGGEKAVFTGAKRLLERPLDIYKDICEEQEIIFEKSEQSLTVCGQLKPAHFRIPGWISSQFITGLLFALPLLERDSIVEILPPVESKAYIAMTLEALSLYGIEIYRRQDTIYVKANQTYRAYQGEVEGDYSNAAFLEALNVIGGNVEVSGLREYSYQGDQVYRNYFNQIKMGNPILDISDCPDLGPILMGLAAAKYGATFTGTRRLKIKESDRGTVMAKELAKFGIQVQVEENMIVVNCGELKAPTEKLESHNDHRIAMSLATLCTLTGGCIEECESVRKSFPGYYDVLGELGISVQIEE